MRVRIGTPAVSGNVLFEAALDVFSKTTTANPTRGNWRADWRTCCPQPV